MSLPTITALPPAPNRKQPALFSARMDDFLAALPVFAGELTAVGAAINQLALDAAGSAAAALQHKQDAQQALQQAQAQVLLAADQVALATQKVVLAAAQATLAGEYAEDADTARAAALAAAAAAGAAAGLPALAGKARMMLVVRADETGVEWTGDPPTSSVVRLTKAAAYTALPADKGALIDCSGTWVLGFAPAATLGAGWWCYVRNAGSGVITADPSGAELIDGVASGTVLSGMTLLVQCDGAAFHCVRVGPRVAIEALITGTSWICPLGVRSVDVQIQGAGYGGPGGANNGGTFYGSPGVPGKVAWAVVQTTPGSAVSYAIGAGGLGGAAPGQAGGQPGTTNFGPVQIASNGTVTGAKFSVGPTTPPTLSSLTLYMAPSLLGGGSYGYGGSAGQSNPSGGTAGFSGGQALIILRY